MVDSTSSAIASCPQALKAPANRPAITLWLPPRSCLAKTLPSFSPSSAIWASRAYVL
jgi:hypothetical protein